MENELYNFEVVDRNSFVTFIDMLHKDLIENPDDWENVNLLDFLEAFSAYAESIQNYYDNMKIDIDADKPSWRTFADIFLGAKVYE